MNIKRKKLNLKVKKEFQKWLLVRMLGVVFLSSMIAALILYIYARKEISDSFYDAHIRIRYVSDLLFPVVAAGSFVSLLSGMALALFLPQKIAGPIYRIELELRAVQDGNLTTNIRLRKKDILKDFVATINTTLFSMRDKVVRLRKSQEEFEKVLWVENKEEIEKALKVVRENIDQFKV